MHLRAYGELLGVAMIALPTPRAVIRRIERTGANLGLPAASRDTAGPRPCGDAPGRPAKGTAGRRQGRERGAGGGPAAPPHAANAPMSLRARP